MDDLAKIFRMAVMGEDTVKGIAVTIENIADAATITKEDLTVESNFAYDILREHQFAGDQRDAHKSINWTIFIQLIRRHLRYDCDYKNDIPTKGCLDFS